MKQNRKTTQEIPYKHTKGLSEDKEDLQNTLEPGVSQHIQDGSAARQVCATSAGTPTQLRKLMQ